MRTRPFLLHALSPLHAGTGQAADVVDLPVARMKATGIPFVPGSSIKGVLRDVRSTNGEHKERILAVFGPEREDASAHAGALVVGDARLLALPVRAFRGTFAWVSSPLLLRLTQRDLGTALPIPRIDERGARFAPGRDACIHGGRLYLEDLDLPAKDSPVVGPWAELLTPIVSPGEDIFSKRFLVVDDETMTFLWETATQVDARIRIDQDTRTAMRGAFWLEESLPPETLLIGIVAGDQSRRNDVRMTPDKVLEFALPSEEVLQFGGKATAGRGRCRIIPVPGGGNGR